MEKLDLDAMAQQMPRMAEAVRVVVATEVSALASHFATRIDALDARITAIPAGAPGEPGQSIKGDQGEQGPAGKDGASLHPDTVALMVRDAVDKAVAARPKDVEQGAGIHIDSRADPEMVREVVARAVAALPPAKDGKDGASIHPDTVALMVREAVDKAVALRPKDDGADADPVELRVREAVDLAVAALPPAKDGKDGASIHPDTVALMVRDAVDLAVAKVALPKDGKDGAPGRDAAELSVLPGIDEARSYPAGTYAKHMGGEIRAERRTDPVKDGDLAAAGWSVAREGIAGVVVTQGEDPRVIDVACMLTGGAKTVSAWRMPVMIYREIWREGEFDQGDVVTWGGSAWHCQRKTTDKPGTSADWKLMVKEGARGKDAERPAAAARDVVRLR